MGAMSRRKGAAGELELAKFLEGILGVPASRSARNGVDQAEDIHHEIPGLHIECKRVETINVHKALAQAEVASEGKKIPTVWFRRNRGEWILAVPAKHLPILARLVAGVLDRNGKD